MIDNLGDLKKLLQLCRKQGVTEIKLGTIELKFGDLPVDNQSNVEVQEDDSVIDQLVGFDNPLAFYSVNQVDQ